jgi:hypothetical protein
LFTCSHPLYSFKVLKITPILAFPLHYSYHETLFLPAIEILLAFIQYYRLNV